MSVTINGRKATMDEEKQLAIEMWEFVRVCQTDLCTRWDSESLKDKFCHMKLKCGISIEWCNDCFLCEHECSCFDCPLYEIGGKRDCTYDDSPFDITNSPNSHEYSKIDEAIDKIIEAIEEF